MSNNFNFEDAEDPTMKTQLVVQKEWFGNMLKLTYRIGDIERVAYMITSENTRRITTKREPNWN
jgi:hypothetical protein